MPRPPNTSVSRIAVRDRLYARLLLRTDINEAERGTYAALVQSDLDVVWANETPLLAPLREALDHYDLTGDGCVKRARHLRWLMADGGVVELQENAVKEVALGGLEAVRDKQDRERAMKIDAVLNALNE